MQSFIHSALAAAAARHSSGAERLIQHFRILLAIISYEHTQKHTHTHTRANSWKWFDNEKEIKCMLSRSFLCSLTHMQLAAAAVAAISVCIRVPNIRFRRALRLSRVCLSVSDMMWYVAVLCVCVCVCLLCIFQIELHIAGNRTGVPSTKVRTGQFHCIPIVAMPVPWLSRTPPPPHASSLSALFSLDLAQPSADAAEPGQQGQLKHICMLVQRERASKWKEAYSVYWLRLVSVLHERSWSRSRPQCRLSVTVISIRMPPCHAHGHAIQMLSMPFNCGNDYDKRQRESVLRVGRVVGLIVWPRILDMFVSEFLVAEQKTGKVLKYFKDSWLIN